MLKRISTVVLAMGSFFVLTGAAETAMAQQAATTRAGCATLITYIKRISNTRYAIRADMYRCSPGYLEVSCRPVHRHSFYWHKHGIVISRGTTGSVYTGLGTAWSRAIKGTNGDHYKANCRFYRNNTYLGTRESRTIEL